MKLERFFILISLWISPGGCNLLWGLIWVVRHPYSDATLFTFKCICLVLITICWVASRVQSSQPSAPTSISNNEKQINIQIKTSFSNRKNWNQKFPENAHRWLVIFLVWHKVLPVKIEIDIQWNCEAEIGPKNVKVCLSNFFFSCIYPPFTIPFFWSGVHILTQGQEVWFDY